MTKKNLNLDRAVITNLGVVYIHGEPRTMGRKDLEDMERRGEIRVVNPEGWKYLSRS